jgi:hypothetical protein
VLHLLGSKQLDSFSLLQPTDHLRRIAARATEIRVASHGFWFKVRAGHRCTLRRPASGSTACIQVAAGRPSAYRSGGEAELPRSCSVFVKRRRVRFAAAAESGCLVVKKDHLQAGREVECAGWLRCRVDGQPGRRGAGRKGEGRRPPPDGGANSQPAPHHVARIRRSCPFSLSPPQRYRRTAACTRGILAASPVCTRWCEARSSPAHSGRLACSQSQTRPLAPSSSSEWQASLRASRARGAPELRAERDASSLGPRLARTPRLRNHEGYPCPHSLNALACLEHARIGTGRQVE